MDATDNSGSEKLEKHLKLLKQEYIKLQKQYTELEKKYDKTLASISNDEAAGDIGSYSRLHNTIYNMYGRTTFSDITVRLKTKTIPGHKIVLNARSEEWKEEVLINLNELDWSHLEDDIGSALLRWLYTDEVDLQNDRIALGLLKAANNFNLPGLMGLCERALVTSVGVRTCVRFYCVAEEVGALSLLEYCSGLISANWDELTSQDFEHMSGPLLFKMLKTKTKHPLHAAIRLVREDVVFLYLVEHDGQLSNLVNSLSEQGLLPLQMALQDKNLAIAETLVKQGSADINAFDAKGDTILIDAIKRGEALTSQFMLDHDCNLDIPARQSGNTALHTICSELKANAEWEIPEEMLEVAKQILAKKPNVNLKNVNGQTPLHLAIETNNFPLVDLLLETPNIDINIQTKQEQSALELSLTNIPENGLEECLRISEKLLKLGANANLLKSETQNNILQVLSLKALEDSAIFLVQYSDVDHINKSGMTAMHIAAEKDLWKLVTALLDANASPNIRSDESQLKTPLHFAVESNALNVVKAMTDFRNRIANNENSTQTTPPDFNAKDAKGDSPLSLCLALNHSDLVPILIDGGADVNARNGENLTLLHQAIINHNSETAVFLLEQGADMNSLTSDGKSPLQLAIECHLPEVVDALCRQGVAFNALENSENDPPLWTALELGYEDIAQVLVRHGIDTDCWGPGPDNCQQTLLHRAIDNNKENIAIFLIKNQCDLDSPRQLGPNGEGGSEAKDKATPLHLCCQWGLTKVLQALIDHGANVNALDVDNKTPLHIAIENQHEEIISILLCHPSIDLKLRDKSGDTPFATALNQRNNKAAQRILNRFPSAAEQMDQRGRNFLHIAIMKDDLESVLFLLGIQVDVNSRVHDANQSTPLHLAAASQKEMITRNLILAGARVNERDAVQRTPLHIAAERCNLPVVSALIQNGADFDMVDNDGNNALHIGVRGGHFSIVRELLTESHINAESTNFKGRNPLHELCRTGEDNTAASICEFFIECMPKYPINAPDMDGNTPLLLAFMRGQAPLCKVLVKNGACLGTENRDGVNIFNFKLATDQLLHKLLDQLPQESPWAESDLCQECGTKFTLTMRKHHCRHCGRVLCSKCSNNDVPILKFGINKPVRVCVICFTVLQGGGGGSGGGNGYQT